MLARMEALEREVHDLKSATSATTALHAVHHIENVTRLTAIEKSLTEIGVYLRIGRVVMNIIWAVCGTVVGALLIKWLGAKT
jgi:hypothetical protein